MTTFSRWLSDQMVRDSQDPIGWLARAWASLDSDQRARISSPTKIKQRLAEHGSQAQEWQDYLTVAVNAAVDAYRATKLDVADRLPEPTQQLSPAADELKPDLADKIEREDAAAERAADQAEPGQVEFGGWEGWATDPQERLGTCLTCGALMGVGMIKGSKALICANGHAIGKRAAQQLIAAADAAEQRPRGPHPDQVIMDEVPQSDIGTLGIDVTALRKQVYALSAYVQGLETMLGLLAQMLAAASPAAAQVMAEFVQADGPQEAPQPSVEIPRLQPEPPMPQSFADYYGMAENDDQA